MMNTKIYANCPRCGIDGSLKDRDFSNQAIAALVTWGELEKEVVGKPICGECYTELRDVLVERTDEVSPAVMKAS